jgi:hypothetical protein
MLVVVWMMMLIQSRRPRIRAATLRSAFSGLFEIK